MSDFNAANDLASQLVWGRYYQGNERCFPITIIVFHHGLDSDERIVVADNGTGWAAIASRILGLLDQGYDYTTLPCGYCGATEMDDVLCCEECGEGIPHGDERPGTDEHGDGVTYCYGCQTNHDDASLEEL
jgi:hypothetical protein